MLVNLVGRGKASGSVASGAKDILDCAGARVSLRNDLDQFAINSRVACISERKQVPCLCKFGFATLVKFGRNAFGIFKPFFKSFLP